MQAIKKKLRSRRGASITFALLIFLVCAVLSSVIIVAASTAAGRMSNLAETDRRYYAVTSAAELMKDLLRDPVSIVKVTENTSVTTTTNIRTDKEIKKIIPTGEINEDGEALTEEVVSTEMTWTKLVGTPVNTKNETEYLLPKEAKDISETDYTAGSQISGEGAGTQLKASVANDAAYRVYNGSNNATTLTRNIQLKPSVDTIPEVKIKETLKPKAEDRLLTLEICDTGEKPYTLELHFQGSETDSVVPTKKQPDTIGTSPATVSVNTTSYEEIDENDVTIQVIVTTTKTTTYTTETRRWTDTGISTINWELVDIRTHTAA